MNIKGYTYPYLSKELALIAIFSALVFIASLLNKFTLQGGQIIFSIVFATGMLVIGFPGAGTLLAVIAGSLYMFQSSLGFMILTTFIVRGGVTDILFYLLRIYKESDEGKFSWVKIATSMMIASFLTGLYQYFFFVIFVKMLIDFGRFIVSIIFIVAILSNGVGGFIVAKYIMPQTHKIGKPV